MREKLIELAGDYFDSVPWYADIEDLNPEELADHLIANDVVPVVRCKDCKHYDNSEGIQWCHVNSKFGKFAMDWHSFPEDGFCSYGERRTDG